MSAADADVFVITGVTPEVNAYAMAKYSRSALSMRESLREIDGQRAEKFLNTFYFQYGHRSIADLAHVSMALERLSILAAIEVADEPRWDGQERSTRYQEFRSSGWITPEELEAEPGYAAAIQQLFAAYEALTPRLQAHLAALHPRPQDMKPETYQRTLRARAFDVTRYLLPLATSTSLGQIVSARTLEQQIVRLLSSTFAECRSLAQKLKQAAGEPGTLPTLVKYTEPSSYQRDSRRELSAAARELLDLVPPDHAPGVCLVEPADLEIELTASLLYPHCHHSYRQILDLVGGCSPARRAEIVALGRAHRGSHDELLREYQVGQRFQFDILLDIGAFRDLHRHRRCTQLHQDYTAAHGYATPALLQASGTAQEYAAAMNTAGDWIKARALPAAAYGLPLGFYKRSLFKMDLAELIYIAELRTGVGGHFSYRLAAWQMFEALRNRYPALAEGLRVTDPSVAADPLQR